MTGKKNVLGSYGVVLGFVAIGATACTAVKSQAPQPLASATPAFISGILPEGLIEASGVIPLEGLPNDEVLIVGDKDLAGGSIENATECFNTGNFTGHFHQLSAELKNSIAVNDMEDVAWDKKGKTAFVLVSGSKNSSDERKAKREKLLQLTSDAGTGQFTGKEVPAFKDQIVTAFPELKPSVESDSGAGGDQGTFNMEGLAFVPGANLQSDKLLFGFRSPTHGNDAIVITAKNPHQIFDTNAKAQFEKTPHHLDLHGQGIRGLCYDEERKGCWIVSGESANAEAVAHEGWKLWFWDMKMPPVEKTIEKGGLKNAEAVCRMSLRGKPGLLLLEDAGENQCHYLLVPMPQ